ncbi:uncharacterized protein LOC103934308 [Pyrus x bretschneideri]|uniref:uncharacterized protein LOC103934308 n=1 Tax=Pyrus x bretschneideri TaxID=225117 RepID=UPI0020309393|nr:uncharacterized protein LOC103934308 [Pyrus x bretschneideri]XP_048444902.1 uncharacterized protein LOC103934308 [Pyrus x bretschneideri]
MRRNQIEYPHFSGVCSQMLPISTYGRQFQEWCEKQMEFVLLVGKRKESKAMKAGVARHAKLEEEVVKRAKVRVKLIEDKWDPKSRLSGWSEPNIEDAGGLKSAQKMTRVADSLHLCRKKGLSVTYFTIIDIETMQWYDRNMELVFLCGMQEVSKAMEACIARHAKLEEEIQVTERPFITR